MLFPTEHCWINLDQIAAIERRPRPGRDNVLAILSSGDAVELTDIELDLIMARSRAALAPWNVVGLHGLANFGSRAQRTDS